LPCMVHPAEARGLHPNPREIQPCVIAIKAIAHVA
jgi:hypothetical protein